jgi:hypothetical protein
MKMLRPWGTPNTRDVSGLSQTTGKSNASCACLGICTSLQRAAFVFRDSVEEQRGRAKGAEGGD